MKKVIQQANQEQIQALAKNNPTLMKDTATTAGYTQFVQDLQSLSTAGVTSIKLNKLTWGPITLQNPTTVHATTIETWQATLSSGVTQQQTNTNVYTLVLQSGSWKIQSDAHPSTGAPQSASGSPSSPGSSTIPVTSLNQSQNWAGYAATGGTFTSVSGTWTVPTVSTATSPAANATWVGIGGVTSTDLIQAGTQAIVQGGQVTYAAWIETLPQSSHDVTLTVSPGDKVSVSITQQSTGNWQVTIKDLTTGKSYQTSVYYQSSLSSAEWIEESPTAGRQQVPLDNFGKVSFTGATTVENGQTRSIQQANGQQITMSAGYGQALAQTSTLGSSGSSFTVTRTNVVAPQIIQGGRTFRSQGGYSNTSMHS